MGKRAARVFRWLTLAWATIIFMGVGFRVLADCSRFGLPFTDLGSVSGFCAAIAEAYYTGITNGTSPTTFSPSANVTRTQAAAFATRTLDAALARGSRRAALGQWWTTTPHYDVSLGLTSVGTRPSSLASDGADVWVTSQDSGRISRVRASDGTLLETWTGATVPTNGIRVAMGRVFVIGGINIPGTLSMIDPTQSAGAVTDVATVGKTPTDIAFDGNNLWTANFGGHSVSIVSPGSWSVSTVSVGTTLAGLAVNALVFDGTNMWVTVYDVASLAGSVLRLDSAGGVLQTITVGNAPSHPVFDGANLWVPNESDDSLSVVRASDGVVLKTFSAANGDQNGLSSPTWAAFDGENVLVTDPSGHGISLFRATDLAPLGFFSMAGHNPSSACSDGQNFWVTLITTDAVGRY